MKRTRAVQFLAAGIVIVAVGGCGGVESTIFAGVGDELPAETTDQETPATSLGDTSQHEGDVTIDGAQTFSGQVTGKLTVAATGNLVLNGQVVEDLIVEAGGRAEIYGMVIGDLVNRGGDVIVYGTVEGEIRDEGATTTRIESGAVIGGEVVP